MSERHLKGVYAFGVGGADDVASFFKVEYGRIVDHGVGNLLSGGIVDADVSVEAADGDKPVGSGNLGTVGGGGGDAVDDAGNDAGGIEDFAAVAIKQKDDEGQVFRFRYIRWNVDAEGFCLRLTLDDGSIDAIGETVYVVAVTCHVVHVHLELRCLADEIAEVGRHRFGVVLIVDAVVVALNTRKSVFGEDETVGIGCSLGVDAEANVGGEGDFAGIGIEGGIL